MSLLIDATAHRPFGWRDVAVSENGTTSVPRTEINHMSPSMARACLLSWYTLLALKRKRNVLEDIEAMPIQDDMCSTVLQAFNGTTEGSHRTRREIQ